MSPALSRIDEHLDEWGSRLFNVSTSPSLRLRSVSTFVLVGQACEHRRRTQHAIGSRHLCAQITDCSPHTGFFLFEFLRYGMSGEEFCSRPDTFLGQLPKDFRYAVEIRNAGLLVSDYRKVLEHHGVAHVYNHWSYMPPLPDQHQRMEDRFTAHFAVLRLLTPLKMTYEAAKKRAEPYTKIVEELPEMRRDTIELVKKAVEEKRKAYVLVNNRSEGNAPLTIHALVKALQTG